MHQGIKASERAAQQLHLGCKGAASDALLLVAQAAWQARCQARPKQRSTCTAGEG